MFQIIVETPQGPQICSVRAIGENKRELSNFPLPDGVEKAYNVGVGYNDPGDSELYNSVTFRIFQYEDGKVKPETVELRSVENGRPVKKSLIRCFGTSLSDGRPNPNGQWVREAGEALQLLMTPEDTLALVKEAKQASVNRETRASSASAEAQLEDA